MLVEYTEQNLQMMHDLDELMKEKGAEVLHAIDAYRYMVIKGDQGLNNFCPEERQHNVQYWDDLEALYYTSKYWYLDYLSAWGDIKKIFD